MKIKKYNRINGMLLAIVCITSIGAQAAPAPQTTASSEAKAGYADYQPRRNNSPKDLSALWLLGAGFIALGIYSRKKEIEN